MIKKLMLTLMSGLFLTSCFSPVIAGKTDQENKDINWDAIAYQMIETPISMIGYGVVGFGTAFVPTGTFVFSLATLLALAGQQEVQMNAKNEAEKALLEIKTLLIVGAGVAGHAAGCYLLLKAVKQAWETL